MKNTSNTLITLETGNQTGSTDLTVAREEFIFLPCFPFRGEKDPLFIAKNISILPLFFDNRIIWSPRTTYQFTLRHTTAVALRMVALFRNHLNILQVGFCFISSNKLLDIKSNF